MKLKKEISSINIFNAILLIAGEDGCVPLYLLKTIVKETTLYFIG